jgi:hypothetical protein
LDDVNHAWSVDVRRQVKAVALDGDSLDGDTSALEVILVVVPGLDPTRLGLDAVVGLAGLELVDLALILPPLAGLRLLIG